MFFSCPVLGRIKDSWKNSPPPPPTPPFISFFLFCRCEICNTPVTHRASLWGNARAPSWQQPIKIIVWPLFLEKGRSLKTSNLFCPVTNENVLSNLSCVFWSYCSLYSMFSCSCEACSSVDYCESVGGQGAELSTSAGCR